MLSTRRRLAMPDTISDSRSRTLSGDVWHTMKTRTSAVALVLLALFCLNVGLHVFTPYDHYKYQNDYKQALKQLTSQGDEPVLSPEMHTTVATHEPTGTYHLSRHLQEARSSDGPDCVGCDKLKNLHTKPAPVGHTYMIGYGSLMNQKSRHKTSHTGSAVPVLVRGFRRDWNYDQDERKMTAVGVVKDPANSLNAVLVLVPKASLPRFDRREQRYHRVLVDHAAIELHPASDPAAQSFSLNPADQVWMYAVDKPVVPTPDLPICQSYVDVIMAGCLQFGEKFAAECAYKTGNWRSSDNSDAPVWVNDRAAPRIYEKGFIDDGTIQKIDHILKQQHPRAFALRKDVTTLPPELEAKAASSGGVVTPAPAPAADARPNHPIATTA